MNLASISENRDIEKRIAITPEIAKKYISLGFSLTLPYNYGTHLGFSNEDYKNLGVNFLDNEDDEEKIEKQLMKLVKRSEKDGSAIGIGHVKPKTLNVLSDQIPRLKKMGYKFEFVSNMLH